MINPTFVDTPLLPPGVLDWVKDMGIKVASTEDVVDGAMRCLCDVNVHGRSLWICAGEANGGKPGSASFDICDDPAGFLGGKAMHENAEKIFTVPKS